MMMAMSLSLLLTMTFLMATKNPMKASITTLLMGMFLFLTMGIYSGSSWISLISMLMFSGGILIMFMILSSFHPNETPKKMNYKTSLAGTLVMISLLLKESTQMKSSVEIMFKTFYHNLTTTILFTLIITLYFIIFLKVLSKEKTSMRLIVC